MQPLENISFGGGILMVRKILLLCLMLSLNCYAENSFDYVDANKFVGIRVNTAQQQKNPLNTVLNITMPAKVTTVGQAITFTLEGSGYSLSPFTALTEETRILLSLTLPKIHREFRVQTLQSILKALCGDSYLLMIDPVKREINFILNIAKS